MLYALPRFDPLKRKKMEGDAETECRIGISIMHEWLGSMQPLFSEKLVVHVWLQNAYKFLTKKILEIMFASWHP